MFDHIDWIAFLIAMAAVELTPGPNMGWLAALSAQYGRAAGLRAVVGITLGLTVQLLAAATGLSTLLAELPVLYEALGTGSDKNWKPTARRLSCARLSRSCCSESPSGLAFRPGGRLPDWHAPCEGMCGGNSNHAKHLPAPGAHQPGAFF